MADDIVTRLRQNGKLIAGPTKWEAADEIEHLRAVNKKLWAIVKMLLEPTPKEDPQ